MIKLFLLVETVRGGVLDLGFACEEELTPICSTGGVERLVDRFGIVHVLNSGPSLDIWELAELGLMDEGGSLAELLSVMFELIFCIHLVHLHTIPHTVLLKNKGL
jgi:hypothetical protein